MLTGFGTALKAIKEAGPVVYFGLFAASGLLLFLPETMAKIGLAEIRQQYLTYLGICWIGSASLLAAHGFGALGHPIRQLWRNWQLDRAMFQVLQGSTAAEKQMLRRYIVDGENTIEVPFNNGVAQGLKAKRVLYTAVNVTAPGRPGFVMPFNMQPHARKILDKYPALLN